MGCNAATFDLSPEAFQAIAARQIDSILNVNIGGLVAVSIGSISVPEPMPTFPLFFARKKRFLHVQIVSIHFFNRVRLSPPPTKQKSLWTYQTATVLLFGNAEPLPLYICVKSCSSSSLYKYKLSLILSRLHSVLPLYFSCASRSPHPQFSSSKDLCKQLGIRRLPTVQIYDGSNGM